MNLGLCVIDDLGHDLILFNGGGDSSELYRPGENGPLDFLRSVFIVVLVRCGNEGYKLVEALEIAGFQ